MFKKKLYELKLNKHLKKNNNNKINKYLLKLGINNIKDIQFIQNGGYGVEINNMQYAQFFGFYQNDSYYSFNPLKFLACGMSSLVYEYIMTITKSDQSIIKKEVIVKKFTNENIYNNEKLLWLTIKNISESIKCKLKYFSDLYSILIYDYLGLTFDTIKSNLFIKFTLLHKLKIIKDLINEVYYSTLDINNYIIHCDIKPNNFVVNIKFDNYNKNIISVEGSLIDYGSAFIKQYLDNNNFNNLVYTPLFSNPLTYEINKLLKNIKDRKEIQNDELRDKLIKSQYWAISSIIIGVIFNDGNYYKDLVNKYFDININKQSFLTKGINSNEFLNYLYTDFHKKINKSQLDLLDKLDSLDKEIPYELPLLTDSDKLLKKKNPFGKNNHTGGNDDFYSIEISEKLLNLIKSLFEYNLTFDKIKEMSDLL